MASQMAMAKPDGDGLTMQRWFGHRAPVAWSFDNGQSHSRMAKSCDLRSVYKDPLVLVGRQNILSEVSLQEVLGMEIKFT